MRFPVEETFSLSDASTIPVPVVSEEAGVLTLHFQSEYVQSQMLLDDPDCLTLSYSRAMMAFELFKPVPHQIVIGPSAWNFRDEVLRCLLHGK